MDGWQQGLQRHFYLKLDDIIFIIRTIANTFEQERSRMLTDKTLTLLNWIYEVCSLYINPFVYEYVVNVQHRGKGAADRTTAHIVRGFMNKLLNDPNLKYILDNIRNEKKSNTTAT